MYGHFRKQSFVKSWVLKSWEREISGQNKENEKKNGNEGAVQERTFNYFACPQPKDLNLFMSGPYKK